MAGLLVACVGGKLVLATLQVGELLCWLPSLLHPVLLVAVVCSHICLFLGVFLMDACFKKSRLGKHNVCKELLYTRCAHF